MKEFDIPQPLLTIQKVSEVLKEFETEVNTNPQQLTTVHFVTNTGMTVLALKGSSVTRIQFIFEEGLPFLQFQFSIYTKETENPHVVEWTLPFWLTSRQDIWFTGLRLQCMPPSEWRKEHVPNTQNEWRLTLAGFPCKGYDSAPWSAKDYTFLRLFLEEEVQ